MDEHKIEQIPSLFALKTSSGNIKVKRDSFSKEEFNKSEEHSTSRNKFKNIAKVVSFLSDHLEKQDSNQSFSFINTDVDKGILKYNRDSVENLGNIDKQFVKSPSISNLSTRSLISSEYKEFKAIQEFNEPSNSEESEDYYGWDGEEAKFKESSLVESKSSVPKCIPPWAKTLKKRYGITSSFNEEENMRDKIKNIMAKYDDVMLVKRVESKKELIVEPKCYSDIDTVKMRAKNTRYYMAPITKKGTKESVDCGTHTDTYVGEKRNRFSLPETGDKDSMFITRKASKHRAKKELSAVLKTLDQASVEKFKIPLEKEHSTKKGKLKCPKITLSKIREYVNNQALDQEESKLHEIIKIKQVPSNTVENRGKLGSKYIINVPTSSTSDKTTINLIKIKEKQKFQSNNIEDINEKVTELHYTQGSSRKHKRMRNELLPQTSLENEILENIKRKESSPTNTKTFQVISKQTPIIAPLIEHESQKTDKVLMIQYEKKSKPWKTSTDGGPTICTTQLLGIKESPSENVGQMYLYGSEGVGSNVKENITKVEDVSPSLKDKVNLIFKELREMAFKPGPSKILTTSEVQVTPKVTTQTTQHLHPLVTTDVATVQAIPDVRSVEVQVRQSQLLNVDYSSMAVSHAIPSSDLLTDKRKIEKKVEVDESKDAPKRLLDFIGDKDELERVEATTQKEKRLSKTNILDDTIVGQDAYTSSLIISDKLKDDKDKLSIIKVEVDEGEEFKIEDSELKKLEVESSYQAVQTEKPELKDIDVAIFKDDSSKVSANEIDLKKDETSLTKQELSDENLKLKDDLLPEKDLDTESIIVSEIIEEETIPFKIEEETIPFKIEEETIPFKIEEETIPFKIEEETVSLKVKEDRVKFVTSEQKLSRSSKESKESSNITDEMKDFTFITNLKKEDIRSYDFDPNQETELKYKSSSKFLHKRGSIRKKMNWTDNTIYLEMNTCPQLIRGLAETAVKRPADPINFLAHWIYKNCHNQEIEEQNQVFKEHLYLAKAMTEVSQENNNERNKFNLRKYPITQFLQEKSNFSQENIKKPI